MAHNFLWTSENVENCPEHLLCGVELVDGMINIINLNPNREEYLMSETKANASVDFTGVTADWFSAHITVNDNYTFLYVNFMDPASANGETPADDEFMNISNLQILKDGSGKKMDLEFKIQKTLVDPELIEMLNRH